MKIKTKRENPEGEGEEEQPMSPAARLFHAPEFNCYIISVIGCKIKIDTDVIIHGLNHSLIRHPRFSSKLVINGNKRQKQRWVRTKVKAEDHVVVPTIEPHDVENPNEFLENYVSDLTTVPLDISRPLWELHILDVKTSEAENVAVLKVHHSVGDGMSLMSLILACTRKTSNPEEIPSLPVNKNRSKSQFTGLRSESRFWWLVLAMWSVILLAFNTLCDVFEFVATTLFLKDTETPIKGERSGLTENKRRRLVHRTVSFDDIKLIKNTSKMTVNDVVLGVTQAGLTRYLNRKYGDSEEREEAKEYKSENNLPKRLRLRAAVLVNIRPNTGIQALADMMSKGSKCRWGNWIGYIVLPFSIATRNDPLEHLRIAKATIDRKKHSFEAFLTFTVGKFILETFGVKVAANIISRAVSNTTMSFSNMTGPVEEISFYGHPITYLAPSVYGHPHALTMHFQSYMNKMIMSLTVDPTVISDPHRLCDDLVESLRSIKTAVLAKGFVS